MPKSSDPANPYISLQMETFVNEYFANGGEKKKAFYAAGYKDYDGYGYQLWNTPGVQKLVADRKRELKEKFEVKVETILERLAEIADGYKRLAKFKKVDDSGHLYLDFTGATEEDLAFITELDTEVYFDSDDEETKGVKKFKIKGATIGDAKAALDSLAKIMGMFTDKVQHTGPDNGPIEINVDNKEVARRVAFILNKGVKEVQE